MMRYHSFSSEETRAIGEALARSIRPGRGAAIFALRGELGAGKTTFVQGFFKGLGVKRRAPSPTFIIMRRHRIPAAGKSVGVKARAGVPMRTAKRFSNVFHIDAYRLKKGMNLEVLGFKEAFADPRHVVLIEWPERIRGILPKGARRVTFKHGKRENERRIIIER